MLDKDAVKFWLEEYLPKLKQNKESTKILSKKKFKEALKKGVPSEVRGYVWQELIGNELRITNKLYDLLIEKANISEENADKDPVFRKNLKVIKEDLHRTFGELGHFKIGSKLYQPLKNILIAYSVIVPDSNIVYRF